MRTVTQPAMLLPLRQIALALLVALLAQSGARAQTPAPASQVFRLSAQRASGEGLRLVWSIAPGAYLYRDRVRATTAQGTPVFLETPRGEVKDDPTFGPTEVYHGSATADVAAREVPVAGSITVTFQGCAEQGVCYPSQTRAVDPRSLAVTSVDADPAASEAASTPQTWAPQSPAPDALPSREDEPAPSLSGSLAAVLATFLGLGVLLAFTPCVFPMLPILAGILARSGAPPSASRGFALSAAYAVSAALAYGVLGIAAAWSGQNLQVMLQTPAVLAGVSLVFVLLALSTFGLFDLQLPSGWMTRLGTFPATPGGTLGGAAALGFVSALIVGPCVTPPLAAALLYVAGSGDVVRGAGALFAMGLGMGLPLVAVGTFGARLLPRAGAWMVAVRQLFGVMFLGVAVLLLSRVVPGPLALLLWALLALGSGVALLGTAALGPGVLRRTLGIAAAAYGVLLLVGAGAGASDPLRPIPFLAAARPSAVVDAATVTTSAALDQALAEARAQGRPVLLDYAAAWCVSCRDFDRTVLSDPAVRQRLAGFRFIKADVTDSNAQSRALMSRFGVIGMPTLLFLSAPTSVEVPRTRLIGEADREAFLRSLDRADGPT